MKFSKTQIKQYLAGAVFVFVAAGFVFFPQIQARGKLQVVFFSVGQGDSSLVRLPTGEDILIDGGPNNNVLEKLGRSLPFFDRKIELVIVTHPHADHIFGLIEVLERYEVDKVLMTGAENSTDFFEEFLRILEEKNIPVEMADRGDKINFGNVLMEILWPVNGIEVPDAEKKFNDNSIVFNLKYGGNNFLFTGDATCEAEEEIIKLGSIWANSETGFEVLKVPHHGSKTSSCENFLAELKPDAAIISVGKDNKYNLPAAGTVKRLEDFARELFRTDENGDIAFVCDEVACEVKTK
jgi:competence protein ComEC